MRGPVFVLVAALLGACGVQRANVVVPEGAGKPPRWRNMQAIAFEVICPDVEGRLTPNVACEIDVRVRDAEGHTYSTRAHTADPWEFEVTGANILYDASGTGPGAGIIEASLPAGASPPEAYLVRVCARPLRSRLCAERSVPLDRAGLAGPEPAEVERIVVRLGNPEWEQGQAHYLVPGVPVSIAVEALDRSGRAYSTYSETSRLPLDRLELAFQGLGFQERSHTVVPAIPTREVPNPEYAVVARYRGREDLVSVATSVADLAALRGPTEDEALSMHVTVDGSSQELSAAPGQWKPLVVELLDRRGVIHRFPNPRGARSSLLDIRVANGEFDAERSLVRLPESYADAYASPLHVSVSFGPRLVVERIVRADVLSELATWTRPGADSAPFAFAGRDGTDGAEGSTGSVGATGGADSGEYNQGYPGGPGGQGGNGRDGSAGLAGPNVVVRATWVRSVDREKRFALFVVEVQGQNPVVFLRPAGSGPITVESRGGSGGDGGAGGSGGAGGRGGAAYHTGSGGDGGTGGVGGNGAAGGNGGQISIVVTSADLLDLVRVNVPGGAGGSAGPAGDGGEGGESGRVGVTAAVGVLASIRSAAGGGPPPPAPELGNSGISGMAGVAGSSGAPGLDGEILVALEPFRPAVPLARAVLRAVVFEETP